MKRTLLGAAAGVFALVVALSVVAGNASAGTVDPGDEDRKFAYGENVQWFNFDPVHGGGGVTVSDSTVTGWVWGRTVGWVNLGPVVYNGGTQGVTHDGNGNLFGWAWGENVGWISFSCENTDSCATVDYGVEIDPTNGIFKGSAWSRNIGWINFDLGRFSDYAVKTAWAPFATTKAATPDETTAMLHGEASPNGFATTAWFELTFNTPFRHVSVNFQNREVLP